MKIYEFEELPEHFKASLLEKSDSESIKKNLEAQGYRFKLNEDKNNNPGELNSYYLKAFFEGQKIGSTEITEEGGEGVPHGTMVSPEHRRKGIASVLYLIFEEETGLRIKPDKNQSNDAKMLWQNKSNKFGNIRENLDCDKSFYAVSENKIIGSLGVDLISSNGPEVKKVHSNNFETEKGLYLYAAKHFGRLKSGEELTDQTIRVWETIQSMYPENVNFKSGQWFFVKKL